MNFRDIPTYTSWGNYGCDVGLKEVPQTIDFYSRDYGLDMDPDFQRGHVWTNEQRSRFIEHLLKGGQTGREILFNCPNWMSGSGDEGQMVLVDGKQRLTAVLMYLRDEITAFGKHFSEMEGRTLVHLRFHVNSLSTREEILQWYLDLNSGGVVHTPEEIEKVRRLLEKERAHDGEADSPAPR